MTVITSSVTIISSNSCGNIDGKLPGLHTFFGKSLIYPKPPVYKQL